MRTHALMGYDPYRRTNYLAPYQVRRWKKPDHCESCGIKEADHNWIGISLRGSIYGLDALERRHRGLVLTIQFILRGDSGIPLMDLVPIGFKHRPDSNAGAHLGLRTFHSSSGAILLIESSASLITYELTTYAFSKLQLLIPTLTLTPEHFWLPELWTSSKTPGCLARVASFFDSILFAYLRDSSHRQALSFAHDLFAHISWARHRHVRL